MKAKLIASILAILAVVAISGCTQQLAAGCHTTIGTYPINSTLPHSHIWCDGQNTTQQWCNPATGICHTHQIAFTANLAEPAGIGPHTHYLS